MAASSLIVTVCAPHFHLPSEALTRVRGVLIELPAGLIAEHVARFTVRADGYTTYHDTSGPECVRVHRMEGIELPPGHLGVIEPASARHSAFARRYYHYLFELQLHEHVPSWAKPAAWPKLPQPYLRVFGVG